ncbi:MAG: hypothetical protein QM784_38075 [Polyangiaceae bacterium]
MGTVVGPMAPATPLEGELLEIAQQCERDVEARLASKGKSGMSCAQRGTLKHACCDEKVKDSKHKDVHSDASFDAKTGNPVTKKNDGSNPLLPKSEFPDIPRKRTSFLNSAVFLSRSKGKALRRATIAGFMRGKFFPDVVVAADPSKLPGPGNTKAVYDFKISHVLPIRHLIGAKTDFNRNRSCRS